MSGRRENMLKADLTGLYLGSTFQLIHGRVVSRLASGALGGANEFSQSFGYIPHGVYQHHLRRESQYQCYTMVRALVYRLHPGGGA